MKTVLGGTLRVPVCLAALLFAAPLAAQTEFAHLELDRSRPVPPKADIIAAWQKRQASIRSFEFSWTEEETFPLGRQSNPRYPERERLDVPALIRERTFTVHKQLAVNGNQLRYQFELSRAAEPDGIIVAAPANGDTRGLGEARHYTYVSTFDGRAGTVRVTASNDDPPSTTRDVTSFVDAQNLDTRPILLALRPLDPVLGHLLIDRAVTNFVRTMYRGASTMLLEERRDPSGWKTILRIEPERDFIVTQFVTAFEQRSIATIDIDYVKGDWGWLPSAWRVSERLQDGTSRLVSRATVTSYTINR